MPEKCRTRDAKYRNPSIPLESVDNQRIRVIYMRSFHDSYLEDMSLNTAPILKSRNVEHGKIGGLALSLYCSSRLKAGMNTPNVYKCDVNICKQHKSLSVWPWEMLMVVLLAFDLVVRP